MPVVVSSFAAGLLFGLGLIVSRMIDPRKVLGFLDLAGDWDPSLAFVMGGAIPVAAIGYWLAARRGRTLLGGSLGIPTRKDIDARLITGAALFGIGWGLVGLCPGPAVTNLTIGLKEALVFVVAMAVGMTAHGLLYAPSRRRLAN